MSTHDLTALETLAGSLRDAVARSDWEQAAAIDADLHQALRAALGADTDPGPGMATTLGRIMHVYQAAMRDVTEARDRVRAELVGVRDGRRGAAGYLSAAGY
jgi:CO dehydrogenase nickel-insertion accessory protein CooC1